MKKGLVHIYCGDGKGKTTAAVGLAIRCAGSGGKVLFAQFLKNGTSGEIDILRKTENITIAPFYENIKFSFKMSDTEKKEACDAYTAIIENIQKTADMYDMIILDEIIHAVNKGIVGYDTLNGLIASTQAKTEIVLTGRDPSKELCAAADYITEMKKIKHPYDKGVKARKMIEF